MSLGGQNPPQLRTTGVYEAKLSSMVLTVTKQTFITTYKPFYATRTKAPIGYFKNLLKS